MVGSVKYFYDYGRIYNWQSRYASLQTGLKGYFPETNCGSLYLKKDNTGDYVVAHPGGVVLESKCGPFIDPAGLFSVYFFEFPDEKYNFDLRNLDVSTQVSVFKFLEEKGIFNDVNYKERILFDWDNINDFFFRVILTPFGLASLSWSLLLLYRSLSVKKP